jgi:hypothetical protein
MSDAIFKYRLFLLGLAVVILVVVAVWEGC